jgi:hypothetical protein
MEVTLIGKGKIETEKHFQQLEKPLKRNIAWQLQHLCLQ